MNEHDRRRLVDLERHAEHDRVRSSPLTTSGTWTPTFGAATTDGSYTYVAQVGAYTRVANMVLLTFQIGISAVTVAPTGQVRIKGLPAIGTAAALASVTFGYRSILTTTLSGLLLVDTTINLYDGAAAMTPAQLAASTLLYGTLMVQLA